MFWLHTDELWPWLWLVPSNTVPHWPFNAIWQSFVFYTLKMSVSCLTMKYLGGSGKAAFGSRLALIGFALNYFIWAFILPFDCTDSFIPEINVKVIFQNKQRCGHYFRGCVCITCLYASRAYIVKRNRTYIHTHTYINSGLFSQSNSHQQMLINR